MAETIASLNGVKICKMGYEVKPGYWFNVYTNDKFVKSFMLQYDKHAMTKAFNLMISLSDR